MFSLLENLWFLIRMLKLVNFVKLSKNSAKFYSDWNLTLKLKNSYGKSDAPYNTTSFFFKNFLCTKIVIINFSKNVLLDRDKCVAN